MDKTSKETTETLELPLEDFYTLRLIATKNHTTPADIVRRFILAHLGELPPVDPR